MTPKSLSHLARDPLLHLLLAGALAAGMLGAIGRAGIARPRPGWGDDWRPSEATEKRARYLERWVREGRRP